MIKKGLIAGVVLLAVAFGYNWLSGVVFPSLTAEYQNPAIFRPWEDPLMMAYFGYPFVLGIVSAYLWNLIKAKSPLGFAKTYFLIATIPGMYVTYTTFQISLLMVVSWAIVGFLQIFVAGWIFSRVK